MKRALAVSCLLLAGCATNGGARWYAPATWFSHAPASAVDRAEGREDLARSAVVKAAQKASHETALALAVAPASRPVALATTSNANAVALLDQAAGPLTAAEANQLRTTIAGLLSDNAEIRRQAEELKAREQRSIAEISAALVSAETQSAAAATKLRAAFDHENSLANELRAQRAALWICGGIAVLLGIGWLYAQFALGGLPAAAGKALRDLRTNHPAVADVVTPIFDGYLNRHEQDRIRAHA